MKRFQLTYHEVKTKLIRAETQEEAEALAHAYIADRNAPKQRMYDTGATYEYGEVTPLGPNGRRVSTYAPFGPVSLQPDTCPTDADHRIYREFLDSERPREGEEFLARLSGSGE